MIIHKTFGLDLGTTNSTPSIFINGASFCPEDAKLKTIPSLVAQKGEKFVVGAYPKNNPYIEKIRSIKRMMGKDVPILLNGKNYTPEEISAEIIRYCAKLINEQIDKQGNVVYDRIVITVPAYFSIAQKNATRKAGELAGLDVLMLLEEPTAAAINYTVKKDIKNGVYMVYDLGGGTFDVSIIEKIDSIPVVLATAGNNFLGGDNFDNMLAHYFIDVLNNDLGYDIKLNLDNPKDMLKYSALLLAAENVKKNLSQNETYTISYYDIFKDNSSVDLIIEDFSREKFNDLIKDKVVIDTFNECQKALDIFTASGRQLSEIDGIILVGGSCHIPFVRNSVKEKFIDSGLIKNLIIDDQDLAVGYGAGIIAATQPILVEDKNKDLAIEINAPYLIDNMVNISGKVVRGVIDAIGIIYSNNEKKIDIESDNTFMVNIDAVFDDLEYKLYSNGSVVASVEGEIEGNSLIAPTPIQNETIRIEIVDLERQEVEDYPLVEKGEALPCSASHNFKINEYSREQIILPVKEGYREIYQLVIDMPNNVALGSRVTINTEVDILGDVKLTVYLNGKEIKGNVAYADIKDMGASQDELDEQYYSKIDHLKGDQKKVVQSRQENIQREIEEAKNNADYNHYTDAINKYETLVQELPTVMPDLTEDDFDQLEEEINDLVKEQEDIDISKIEDDFFFGRRALKRGDYKQAQERYDKLCGLKSMLALQQDAKTFFVIQLKYIIDMIDDAKKICVTLNDQYLRGEIEKEIISVTVTLNSINYQEIENYDNKECRELSDKIISVSSRLISLLQQTGVKEIDDKIKRFKGRISKD